MANRLYRGPSTFQLLRFPILFGSILISFAVAFQYREKILEGIQEQRDNMYKENPEAQMLLKKNIEKMRKKGGFNE